MKKLLSLTAAVIISATCLAGCGDSDGNDDKVSVSTSTQATTVEATTKVTITTTEPVTEPVTFSGKYSSLRNDTLGNYEEFIYKYKEKLSLIFGINELSFVKSNDLGESTNDYYKYDCDCNGKLTMEIIITVRKDGNIDGLQLKMEDFSGNPVPVFPNNDTATYNRHLCEFLLPIAVFEDYNTQEEILARWSDFTIKPNGGEGAVSKRLFADYFARIDFNEKMGIAFFWDNYRNEKQGLTKPKN